MGGRLTLWDNPALAHVDGLRTLERVGGALEIRENHGLVQVEGLSALRRLEGWLVVDNNDALTSIDGIEGLLRGEGAHIQHNGGLCQGEVDQWMQRFRGGDQHSPDDSALNRRCR